MKKNWGKITTGKTKCNFLDDFFFYLFSFIYLFFKIYTWVASRCALSRILIDMIKNPKKKIHLKVAKTKSCVNHVWVQLLILTFSRKIFHFFITFFVLLFSLKRGVLCLCIRKETSLISLFFSNSFGKRMKFGQLDIRCSCLETSPDFKLGCGANGPKCQSSSWFGVWKI